MGLVEVNKHNYYYSDRQRQVVRYIIAISCHYPPSLFLPSFLSQPIASYPTLNSSSFILVEFAGSLFCSFIFGLWTESVCLGHRLNMELDLQSLFGVLFFYL